MFVTPTKSCVPGSQAAPETRQQKKFAASVVRPAHAASSRSWAQLAWWYIVPRAAFTQQKVIAPNGSEVLVAASTVEKAIAEQLKYTGNKDAAAAVDKAVAERALEKGIKDVSSDRSGFQYHGQVPGMETPPVKLAFSSKVEV